jgi:hypothetical protein
MATKAQILEKLREYEGIAPHQFLAYIAFGGGVVVRETKDVSLGEFSESSQTAEVDRVVYATLDQRMRAAKDAASYFEQSQDTKSVIEKMALIAEAMSV